MSTQDLTLVSQRSRMYRVMLRNFFFCLLLTKPMLEGNRQVRNVSQGNVPILSLGVYGSDIDTRA